MRIKEVSRCVEADQADEAGSRSLMSERLWAVNSIY